MKKFTKGFLTLVLSVMLVGAGLFDASAYSDSVTIKAGNITLGYLDESKNVDYVAVSGELKSDDAVVSNQEISVDYDTYTAIATLSSTYEPQLEDLFKKYNAKEEAVKAKLEEVNALTQGTEEYTKAAAELETLRTESAALEKEYKDKDAEYAAKEKALVPDFDDSKWNKLEFKETANNENRYSAKVSGVYSYFVTWVKVTVNGNDYYNYSVNCLPEEVTLPKCKIVAGKYYDNDGKEITKAEYDKKCGNPKTGNNMYYTYGAVIVVAACGLYMATRKVKKFSK